MQNVSLQSFGWRAFALSLLALTTAACEKQSERVVGPDQSLRRQATVEGDQRPFYYHQG